MKYARVSLGLPINKPFDYLIPTACINKCSVGCRVLVSFLNQNLVGYIVALISKTNVTKVKPITKLIDHEPVLDDKMLRLTKIASDYYCSSWGQAIESGLPAGIRKGMPINLADCPDGIAENKSGDFGVSFVQGDSLAERLKIYSVDINKALEQKKTVIILSPEIKLCIELLELLKQTHLMNCHCEYPERSEGDEAIPKLEIASPSARNDYVRRPGRIAVTYRKQKIGEELRVWQDAKNAQLDVLIGTRPAVFAPMRNLGLIILEEEDGYGYKEKQAPYYHAREVALMRAQLEGCKVILAGRTPTLESYYAIKTKKIKYIGPEPGEDEKFEIKIVDMRQYGFSRKGLRPVVSPALGDRIQKSLTAGKKIIIFVNRKGFAASAYCPKCGLVLTCEKCNRGLAFYSEEKKLICNLCGLTKPMPSVCPQCGARYIKHKGFGIERIKSQLHLSYPQARICRVDKEHDTLPPDAQIILATEMIFHREQVPTADMVAAIDLDKALQIVNYRGNEKLYSLIYRLKTIAKDELLIQTAMPEHYQRKEFIHFNIQKLFDAELKERKALDLPPFTHLAAVSLRGKDQERTKKIAFEVYDKLKDKDGKISIFEPTEGLPAKLRGKYRFSILLKAKNPFHLSDFLRKHLMETRHSGTIVTVEIDP